MSLSTCTGPSWMAAVNLRHAPMKVGLDEECPACEAIERVYTDLCAQITRAENAEGRANTTAADLATQLGAALIELSSARTLAREYGRQLRERAGIRDTDPEHLAAAVIAAQQEIRHWREHAWEPRWEVRENRPLDLRCASCGVVVQATEGGADYQWGEREGQPRGGYTHYAPHCPPLPSDSEPR